MMVQFRCMGVCMSAPMCACTFVCMECRVQIPSLILTHTLYCDTGAYKITLFPHTLPYTIGVRTNSVHCFLTLLLSYSIGANAHSVE